MALVPPAHSFVARRLTRRSIHGVSVPSCGSQAVPWKTIGRAAAAKELRPGDTVLIATGVYREYAQIKVSGEPGRPITLAAAPGARVVLKGSEIITGPWTRLAGHTNEWHDPMIAARGRPPRAGVD